MWRNHSGLKKPEKFFLFYYILIRRNSYITLKQCAEYIILITSEGSSVYPKSAAEKYAYFKAI